MVDVFSAYETELAGIKKALKQLTDSIPTARGEDRQRQVRDAQDAMEQAKELIEKMEFDPKREAKVEGYKRELNSIEGLLRKSVAKAEHADDRESLLGGVRMRDLDLTSRDHQDRYADTTQKLASHSELIRESTRSVEATIGVAQDAMVELDRQGSVIDHAGSRLGDVDANLSRAGRILRGMVRRAMTNKLIMVVIILVLLAGIALTVYLVWWPKSKDSDAL
jgi:vesicle transport through interaction with t-SNAREs protein 1